MAQGCDSKGRGKHLDLGTIPRKPLASQSWAIRPHPAGWGCLPGISVALRARHETAHAGEVPPPVLGLPGLEIVTDLIL